VFLDSGSTVEKIVDFAPQTKMTFITASPQIAIELCRAGPHAVNIVGGRMDRDSLSVSGMHAMKYLEDVNLDIAFLSPSGFSLSGGFTCGNYSECELKSTVAKKARFVVMLMDRTKIDRVLPFTFCKLDDVDVLVTDGELPEQIVKAADESGAKSVYA
jgi:DeoR/GlpR family transcriptional regulator of sugar metabolism